MALVELGSAACSPLTSYGRQPECLTSYPWSSWPRPWVEERAWGWEAGDLGG